jgi:hypothetical protein
MVESSSSVPNKCRDILNWNFRFGVVSRPHAMPVKAAGDEWKRWHLTAALLFKTGEFISSRGRMVLHFLIGNRFTSGFSF